MALNPAKDKTALDRFTRSIPQYDADDDWSVPFPDRQLLAILQSDRNLFMNAIQCLRDSETGLRLIRTRLEALEAGTAARHCLLASCRKPIHGRADRKFCSSACRVKAHRGDPVTDAADTATVAEASGSTDPEAKRRRRPLPDAARRAGWELRKAAERVERLLADERLGDNREQVATALRGHMTYADQVTRSWLDELDAG